MGRAQDKDYSYLGKHRLHKKVAYKLLKVGAQILRKAFFNTRFYAIDKIPKGAAILSVYHAMHIDWMTLAEFPKKCHGWADEEILTNGGFFDNLLEQICVRTDGKSMGQMQRDMLGKSRFWLENTNDLVVIPSDGPSKYLKTNEGDIKPLRDRPNFSPAASLSFKTGYPVVPFSSVVLDPVIADEISFSQGWKKDLGNLGRYLWKNKRRIQYIGMCGEPMHPKDFRNQGQLRKVIREKQIEMDDYLRRQV